LVGYIASAYVTGLIAERAKKRTDLRIFFSMCVGNLVQYLFGVAWLSNFIGIKRAILVGVLPHIPGALLKILFLTKLARKRSAC